MQITPVSRPVLPRLATLAAAGCVALALLGGDCVQAQGRPQTMITPNYKDADLGQIIEAVSQVTGKNFIVDPRVKAQVTMLSSTPMAPDAFYEAFLAILSVHGFVAVQSGKIWKIIPDANARQVPANDLPERVSSSSDELVTQVVALKSVSAAQLVPILRPLIPQYGHLAAYPAANVLIISDRANNVNRMLRIIQRIDLSTDDEVDFIRLEHASAAEIVRVVNSLTQGAGAEAGGAPVKLIADDRTNSVLISGEKSQRLRLRVLVAHLDTPLDKGGGTTVRYLKYADAEKLATKLKEQVQAAAAGAAGAGAAGGAQAGQDRSTTIWAEPTTNSLVITAPPKLMRQLMDVIDRLDIRRLQVQVEAIIVEITGNRNIDLGINWAVNGAQSNIGAGAFNEPIGSGGPSIGSIASAALGGSAALASGAAALPTGLTLGVGRLAKTGTSFAAILSAIEGTANTNIISTPTLVTLDNQEAQIKVTTEVPFITGQYASTAASTPTGTTGVVNPFTTVQRQDVGTILKLTPQITDDGTVLLKIEQEVSALIKSSIQTVDVQTSKRVISTRVLANDGEIIVLGGLISDNVTESEQRVPFLGAIPGLGNLFKTRSSSKDKTNLMVFLRPKILVNAEQMATETDAKYNYIRSLQKAQNGKVTLMPGEHQPALPDLQSLAPRPAPAETPKSRAIRAQSEKAAALATPVAPAAPPESPAATAAPPGDAQTPAAEAAPAAPALPAPPGPN
jgi:general secretion pathway protein D